MKSNKSYRQYRTHKDWKHGDRKKRIDHEVSKLSTIQAKLMFANMSAKDYNKASEMIGELKEFLINCESYNEDIKR